MAELHVQDKIDPKNTNSISFEDRKRQIEKEERREKEKLDPKNTNTISFEAKKRQLEEDERREKEELQRQKKSPYRSWVQMNKDAYKAEDWLMSKSPIAYRIFKFLINNMDSYN